jgi:hypothetical protein
LRTLIFFSADRGYIVGWYNPFTGYTDNGGITWSDDSLGQWFSIDFPSQQTGYIVGWGNLVKTTDGGTTWNDISTSLIQNNGLYSMDFTDENTGYACGENGVIIKTTNGGTTSLDELNSENEITIFPNPVGSEFTVGFKEIVNEINLFNVTGQEIFSDYPSKSSTVIQVMGIPDGMYFLRIKTYKSSFIKKILIQK